MCLNLNTPVPKKEQVQNYINLQNRPFTLQMIADETTISIPTLRCYIAEMIKEGLVTRMPVHKREAYYRRVKVKPKRRYTSRVPGRIYKEDVLNYIDGLEQFTLKDVQKGLDCSYPQARRHVLALQKENRVKAISHNGHIWVYTTNINKSKSKIAKVKNAIKQLAKQNKQITRNSVTQNCDLSLSTVKLVLRALLDTGYIYLAELNDHTKIYKLN